jgi:hypothetical protein
MCTIITTEKTMVQTKSLYFRHTYYKLFITNYNDIIFLITKLVTVIILIYYQH